MRPGWVWDTAPMIEAAEEELAREPAEYELAYAGKRVMVTGGMGFIGSNLARRLAALRARVLLVDSLIPQYGGNPFNIAGIEHRVRVNIADIRQQSTMNYLVRGRDVSEAVMAILLRARGGAADATSDACAAHL